MRGSVWVCEFVSDGGAAMRTLSRALPETLSKIEGAHERKMRCAEARQSSRQGSRHSLGKRLTHRMVGVTLLALQLASVALAAPPDLGTRRELFVDDFLIDRMDRCELRLHQPEKREIAMVFDRPWEGNSCGYATTVFHDGTQYRMYYLARHHNWGGEQIKTSHPDYVAYAESQDGIAWTRPDLGLVDFKGSKTNNLLPEMVFPFFDTNPKAAPDARYKAITCKEGAGLFGQGSVWFWKSADGIHWTRLAEEPLLVDGKLDSHNLVYFDEARDEYRFYYRSFRDSDPPVRGVKTMTSKDFTTWGKSQWVQYSDNRPTQIYLNTIKAYPRAPHLFLGLPMRYVHPNEGMPTWSGQAVWQHYHDSWPNLAERKKRYATEKRIGTAATDTILMTSRDGVRFKRWQEAFLRPGPYNWTYADNACAWYPVETKSDIPGMPNELSLYVSEGFWIGKASSLRRYTLRLDGFVSVHAGGDEAEMVTKPFRFGGKALELNYATSAAGSLRVEIQDADGNVLPGFSLKESHKIVGDHVDRVVSWNGGVDLSKLAGKPVRLRFVMWDADLYAMRFREDIPGGNYGIEPAVYPDTRAVMENTAAGTAGRMVNDILAKLGEASGAKLPNRERLAALVTSRFEDALARAPITQDDYRNAILERGRIPAQYILGIPAAQATPELDGQADEAAWKDAAPVALLLYDPKTATRDAPEHPSTFRAMYDEGSLYVSFSCKEPDFATLIALCTNRDDIVSRDDSVEIGIQPLAGSNASHIVVNSLGSVYDAAAGNRAWNCNLKVAALRNEAGKEWAIELALPWKELGVEAKPGTLLRANFLRNNIENDKTLTGKPFNVGRTEISWAPFPDGFGNPGCYGILVLE